MKKTLIYALLILCIGCFPLFAEDDAEESTEEKQLEITAPAGNIVFPVENLDLVFIEGEEAVSTNFSQEPTLNYGSSGFRTLQLSRFAGLPGGAWHRSSLHRSSLLLHRELVDGPAPPVPGLAGQGPIAHLEREVVVLVLDVADQGPGIVDPTGAPLERAAAAAGDDQVEVPLAPVLVVVAVAGEEDVGAGRLQHRDDDPANRGAAVVLGVP